MRSLLQFLARYSILLLFVALEVLSLILLVRNNEYQRSAVFASSNRVTASLYRATDNIVSYFLLRQVSDHLLEENALMRSQMSTLQEQYELTELGQAIPLTPNVQYIPARVIHLTHNQQRNYLTIDCGTADGIEADMGVITSDGVVGIVSTASEHFAVVIPLLNPTLSISCRLKSNEQVGTLHWEGKDYRYADLEDIARHVEVTEGDTIVTSGFSAVFPADIPVGVIDEVSIREADAYYTIRTRLAVDFKRLHYVYVIRQANRDELKQLESNI